MRLLTTLMLCCSAVFLFALWSMHPTPLCFGLGLIIVGLAVFSVE